MNLQWPELVTEIQENGFIVFAILASIRRLFSSLQKGYIKEETLKRLEVDEEVLSDFFKDVISPAVSPLLSSEKCPWGSLVLVVVLQTRFSLILSSHENEEMSNEQWTVYFSD